MRPKTAVAKLRELMEQHQLDAWLVPSADPHQSEYVADHWKARAWLSGFDGSAGTVVVLRDRAGLWTDARYHIRAAKELAGSGIELHKVGLPGVLSLEDWLARELEEGAVLGFDSSLLSVAEVRKLEEALQPKSISFSYQHDLVGELWQDRPPLPKQCIFLHDDKFSGEPRRSKLRRIRQELADQGAQAHLLTALDEIAWSLNIRGSDVAYNPVAICFALILHDHVRLFLHPEQLPRAVEQDLLEDGVAVSPYRDIWTYWQQLPDRTTVLVDPDKTNYRLHEQISQTCRILEAPSIPGALKAVKNEREIEGMRQAHIRDGVAMVKWLYWLDQNRTSGVHTEITLADELGRIRSEGELFQGPSFGTISGYQANSAVGHYSPHPDTTPNIGPQGILLVDSGGQYLDGTTDITRTIALDTPTARQKDVFTAVLKSLIRLSTTVFPIGTKGTQLDALARDALWQQGWECRHGIGHGIGHFLNVHEGPQRFSKDNDVPFRAGMATTIEPGVYFEGEFGVRTENVVIATPRDSTEFGDFVGFETVTLCPIDLDLVDAALLSAKELAWLDEYHRTVYATLAPHLSRQEQEWLQNETRPIGSDQDQQS